MNFNRFSYLTFDCYGTLIDWEAGILGALLPILERHEVKVDERRIIELYAEFEAVEEAGSYQRYRDVLRGVMMRFGKELGFTATRADCDALAYSAEKWPPFGDTVEALRRLKQRYKLVILSNIDDEIFAETAKLLEVPFDLVITAQQVGSYKPSLNNFRYALDRIDGPKDQVLHVAQSLYHDHAPAKALGLSTAWVNRASRRPGVGLAPLADVKPDIETADLLSLAFLLDGEVESFIFPTSGE